MSVTTTMIRVITGTVILLKLSGLATNVQENTLSEETRWVSAWGELLAPAPIGIAIMSQLLIHASQVTDFEINKIDQKHIPLLKYPESFRTTLIQIANEAYNAFMKAHNNMERIHMKLEHVPGYVMDCFKFLKSGNQAAITKLLPLRLKGMKQAVDGGFELSTEVSDTFLQLQQLIQQVIEATTHSMGEKERAFNAKIEQEKKREEETRERERIKLQEEIENAEKTVEEHQQYFDDTRKRKWDTWLSFIGYESKQKSIEYARQMKEEAEAQLNKIKKESDDRIQKIDKICKENIEKLTKMSQNITNDGSHNQTIASLHNGLKLLGSLQTKWSGITLHFNQIRNGLNEKTTQYVENLACDIDVVKNNTILFELVLGESKINELLESVYISYHEAKIYVKVSNNHIMKSINQMHGMLALSSSEITEAEKNLLTSCTKASEGINNMFKEEEAKKIREKEQKHIELTEKLNELENAEN